MSGTQSTKREQKVKAKHPEKKRVIVKEYERKGKKTRERVYKEVKALVPQKKQELSIETSRHNAIEPLSTSTDGMIIPATINDQSLQQLYQVTASYLFAFGSVITRSQSTKLSPEEAFAGIAYLINGMIQYASSLIETERMPRIHGIIASLLRQKQVRFRYGTVLYTPNIQQQTFSTVMMLGNGDVYFNVVPDLSGAMTITSPGTNIVATQEAYSNILSCFTRKECPLSMIEDVTTLPPVYRKDPSAFARTYEYLGSNGVIGGGLVNDAELEVPFKMPSFSKYVNYDKEDLQIARVLRMQSGGPAMNVAFALTDKQFGEHHLRNPIPTVYKFLDLNEFFIYVTTWLARAWSSLAIQPNNSLGPQQFQFSKYDFLVVLRQAILTQFSASQLHGQFVQPLKQSVGSGSLFKPLVLDPATVPSSSYATLELPSVLKENLSMLKEASYTTSRVNKSGKPLPLRVTYVPVWGFYTLDEVPDIVIPRQDEGTFNMFSDRSILPQYVSITDLRTTNPNTKVNPNSQEALNILAMWNAVVQSVNGITQVSTISSDVNYSGNMLIFTRIQETSVIDIKATTIKLQDPSTQYIKNTVTIQDKTKNSKPMIKAIPAATLYTRTILSAKTIPMELSGNLFSLFLPSLRLDETSSEDKLSQIAWQTYTGEVASQPYSFGENQGGISMTSRAFNFAGHVITAQFSPTSEQDTLAQAMQQLAKYSWGADLFGQIASGLLGLVPVVGPALAGAVQALF